MTTVTVTAGHIARGKREDCERCPVALAIAAAFPDLSGISVGPTELSIKRHRDDLDWTGIDLPHAVTQFIEAFDGTNDGPVEPFTFDLDYPAVAA